MTFAQTRKLLLPCRAFACILALRVIFASAYADGESSDLSRNESTNQSAEASSSGVMTIEITRFGRHLEGLKHVLIYNPDVEGLSTESKRINLQRCGYLICDIDKRLDDLQLALTDIGQSLRSGLLSALGAPFNVKAGVSSRDEIDEYVGTLPDDEVARRLTLLTEILKEHEANIRSPMALAQPRHTADPRTVVRVLGEHQASATLQEEAFKSTSGVGSVPTETRLIRERSRSATPFLLIIVALLGGVFAFLWMRRKSDR